MIESTELPSIAELTAEPSSLERTRENQQHYNNQL